jgi:hypothetical protein
MTVLVQNAQKNHRVLHTQIFVKNSFFLTKIHMFVVLYLNKIFQKTIYRNSLKPERTHGLLCRKCISKHTHFRPYYQNGVCVVDALDSSTHGMLLAGLPTTHLPIHQPSIIISVSNYKIEMCTILLRFYYLIFYFLVHL